MPEKKTLTNNILSTFARYNKMTNLGRKTAEIQEG